MLPDLERPPAGALAVPARRPHRRRRGHGRARPHSPRSWCAWATVVLVEDPRFPPVLDLLDTVGAEVVPVAVDDHGPVPEALQAALARRPVAVYLQPRAQNPTRREHRRPPGQGAGRRCWRRPASWVYRGRPRRRHLDQPRWSASAGTSRPGPSWCRASPRAFGPDLRLAADRGAGRPARRAGGPPPARRRAGRAACCRGCCSSCWPTPPPPRPWPRPAPTYAERRGDLTDALRRPRRRHDRPGRDQPVGRGGRRAGGGLPPRHQRRRRGRRLAVRADPRHARPHPHHARASSGTAAGPLADLVAEAAAPPTPRTRGW